jgi:hypothetical protein
METITKLRKKGYRDISVTNTEGSILQKEQLTDSD